MKKINVIRAFTLIEILIIVSIILVLAAMTIGSFGRVRVDSNESVAVSHTRIISNALFSYHTINNPHTYPESLSNLSSPVVGPAFIDSVLGSGEKQGYIFNYSRTNSDQFDLFIEPIEPGASGERYFYVDETGAIRYNKLGRAGKDDAPIE